ncbi:uncharacterized protein LOC127171544 isoform X2 [Labeo rohita]|uniref:uncharacterized protein LOC127171544 isoform X2 n=1 Tax=Labeo rohita TaxID=84645 RepID=UPI0021E28915|nr:uncharacterized protein LOC127171544 isoform X2 [Labeo rohita]
MFLKWMTNCLLFFTSIYLPNTGAENVFRASEGETVNLPCHLAQNDSVKVSVVWTKHSANSTTICKLIFNKTARSLTGDCISHFNFSSESFTLFLSIENVQPSDSGNYSCKTTRLIPPPTLDDTTYVTLKVNARPHLSLQLNSSNDTCIHLLCSMEGLTTEQVNFTWSRQGQSLLHQFTSNSTSSELHLCKPDWSEGDTITCYANYSGTQTEKSILLSSQNASEKGVELIPLLIISSSAAAGLILCIILPVVICKCRKQEEHGSIVFSNKVYENFSFAMARQNTQPIDKPQPEECIYEN